MKEIVLEIREEKYRFFIELIKSFDFEFGFCIPGSVNTWDAVYSLPAMSEKLSTYFLKI